MSDAFDPQILNEAVVSPRWTGLVRTGLDLDSVIHWDPTLLRQPRVLVPVDVQALYVPPGHTDPAVRLPLALTRPDGEPPEPMPAPFDPGAPRTPGVHLHWAAPDALLRGRMHEAADGARNRLDLPALPDRWVVVRILAPAGSAAPHVKGWVLEADTAKAIALTEWPAGSAGAVPAGRSLTPAELTGTVGGSLNWAGVYDAVVNRLAFHDPLDDLADVAPEGVVGDLAAYVVAGWWSVPALDPLDGAHTSDSLHDRLRQLRWSLQDDAEDGDLLGTMREIDSIRRETIGLPTPDRYATVKGVGAKVKAPSAQAQLALATEAIKAYPTAHSQFADIAAGTFFTEARWPRRTLLHGVVYGVPTAGPVVADGRPKPAATRVFLGAHSDEVAATMACSGLGVTQLEERRRLERLLAAFTGQLLGELGTPEGVVAAEEHEHAAGFQALPGGDGGVERLRPGAQSGPLPAGRKTRGDHFSPKHISQKGAKQKVAMKFGATRAHLTEGQPTKLVEIIEGWKSVEDMPPKVNEVRRPAPRFHLPLDAMVAVTGAGRSLRHGGDGRFSPDGLLQCRWPSQVATAVEGVVDGEDMVPTLGNAAVPDEVLTLVQGAVVGDPYLVPWLAAVAASRRGLDKGVVGRRLMAEAALRFGGRTGVYDGTTAAFATTGGVRAPAGGGSRLEAMLTADQLRRFSLVGGVDLDPVGVTAWSQPWIPLWLEWEVVLETSDRLDGWHLGPVDLEPADNPTATAPRTIMGRSPLHVGTARTLAGAIDEWLRVEGERDRANRGEVDDATADALDRLSDAILNLDVVTANLDRFGPELLGLPVAELGVMRPRDEATGALTPVAPVAAPQLLASGSFQLRRARLIDAFGRTLDLLLAGIRVPARNELHPPSGPAALRLRPRLTRPARLLFRLVDPADPTTDSPEATIDQIDPAAMINPVAGFLLPDHIDEALEAFDAAGTPIGQLLHEPFGGGVMWEIAPLRDGPADAGPLHGLAGGQQIVGHLAAGLVAADAAHREGRPAGTEESALSALLRAIDTTLWTVDTYAGLGTEHIAGLVGRPLAVVRATLRLDISEDLSELDLTDPARRAEREAAYRDLADRAFPVRVGELTRSDDGLIAFFVDDDYDHVHVVDKVVRDAAFESGKGKGQFGQYGTTPQVPAIAPIIHPYVVAEDELLLRPGQIIRLTLLMHPAGKVHLTSGILPRKALALARDWVAPGLAVIAPSVRVGPVLIEPGPVRLPKVSVFPKKQHWTRRDTPSTWKDDPILAATQTALLPDVPADFQEGWIRVAPDQGDEGGTP